MRAELRGGRGGAGPHGKRRDTDDVRFVQRHGLYNGTGYTTAAMDIEQEIIAMICRQEGW